MSQKFKFFVFMSISSFLTVNAYLWANDTNFNQEKNKVIEEIKYSLNNQTNSTAQDIKHYLKDIFNKDDKIYIDSTKNVPLQYQLKFKYDHTNAPEGLSEKQMLNLIENATKTIENSCGVKFLFEGEISSDYISVESKKTSGKNFGIIRWSELADDMLGQAHLGGVNGPVKDFIMDLNNNLFSTYTGKIENDYLQSTILHELGHVIGLPHSRVPESIMFFESRNSPEK